MPVAPKNTPTSTSRPDVYVDTTRKPSPPNDINKKSPHVYLYRYLRTLVIIRCFAFLLVQCCYPCVSCLCQGTRCRPAKATDAHTLGDVEWSLFLMTPLCTSKMVSYLCVCIQSCMFSVTQQRGAIQCGSALTFQMKPARRWLAMSKNCNAQRLAKHAKKSGNLPCREHC